MLQAAERGELLGLARGAVERRIREGRELIAPSESPALHRSGGAFVSLHRFTELRGCIGRIRSSAPLFRTVQEMAVAAATQDYRFAPVDLGELRELEFEISVLSDPEILGDVSQVRVGEHGLIVSAGSRSGLLLPQVATSYGWDAETFLSHTCAKAGLPMEFWKQGRVLIEAFTAEVFSEREI
ncbi:AmmeMemoRadiSam system protein A [bacterium]|nr:MAG: AmmeMemoRadiSam system protein A [bacterium]